MIADYTASGIVPLPDPTAEREGAGESTNPAWQQRYLALVPSIRQHAKLRFRNLPCELQEELFQETLARALVSFLRLVERGKEHVASAGSLARYSVAQVRQGRRVGGERNVHDVSSPYCQYRKAVSLQSLDRRDKASGDWQEILVEDRQSTPAQIAAARIDVRAWLGTLPPRNRRLAERLATGETTSAAAEWLGVSRGRVSQLRTELRRAWHVFQGEAIAAEL